MGSLPRERSGLYNEDKKDYGHSKCCEFFGGVEVVDMHIKQWCVASSKVCKRDRFFASLDRENLQYTSFARLLEALVCSNVSDYQGFSLDYSASPLKAIVLADALTGN